MSIHYPDILQGRTGPWTFSYGDKDVMLYALGVGMGRDPLDPAERAFVYEKDLKVVPTAVTVLSLPSDGQLPKVEFPAESRSSELNNELVVHGEEKVELHRPLPPGGTFTAQGRTIGAYDKGAGKGALIVSETIWRDADGERVATVTASIFARGDGGFGGPAEAPAPHAVPSRAPDLSLDFPTRPDQALLYRLNGDRTPLHCDPEVARRAGYPEPILHGLCTFGITCRAVLQAVTDFDPDQILSHQARFSAPVYPGDTITIDLWKDGKAISFEAHVRARNVTVIKNGLTVLR
jgi:acyl dehydratase